MDNQKQKKKKSVMDTLSATMVLVLIALLLVFVGYTYLALKNGYTLDDLIDNIVVFGQEILDGIIDSLCIRTRCDGNSVRIRQL